MDRSFEITDHGAVPDGITLNTAAIQSAIDACHGAGGGTVACGPGEFLTGSIELRSNVELHLESGCRLVGSTEVADYDDFLAEGFRSDNAPEGDSKSLIRASGAQNTSITGAGAIDGSGLAFYDTDNMRGPFYWKPPTPRPRILMLYECTDVRIENASFIDSPCWTFWLMKCERVSIRGIRILGDQRMINNDGIDLDCCRDVTVSDCVIRTGDDCVVLRAIVKMFDDPMPCENITVTNCVLDSWCQGIRIGCPSDGTIRNAAFSNLTIRSLHHGITLENPKVYLQGDGPGTADIHDIVFTNVTIDSDKLPIRVTIEDGIQLERLSDLSFSNLRIRGGGPLTIKGSPETPVRNVSFSNVRIDTTGDNAIACRNCEGVRMSDVELSNRAARAADQTLNE